MKNYGEVYSSKMLFWTIYRYELKKILSHRVKLLVLLAVAAFLFIVSAQRYFSDSSEQQARKAEQSLDGRIMDENFFTEMRESADQEESVLWYFATLYARKVFRYNESQSIFHSSEEQEEWTEDTFYETRKRVIDEFADAFYLTRKEREYWDEMEESNPKPFIYRSTTDVQNLRETYQFNMTITCLLIAVFLSGSFAGESEDKTDSLIYSSKCCHKYAVATKLIAGCTFSLAIGIMMLLMTHIPVALFSGLHGLDAPWYMVMPFSVMSVKAWKMLLLHTVVYMLGCILTGLLVMMLSLLLDKSMAAAGTVFALILCDLFGSVPTHMRVLSQIRYLTPISVLLNSNVPDMRLTKLFGTYLISFQTGPLLYLLCGFLLVIVIVWNFRRRYCRKNDSGS